jgi:S1-C subfamily serine protease
VAARVGRRRGVEIVDVVAGSPAALAGLRPEDLILSVDGRPIERVDDLQRLMVGEAIGRRVELELLRGGETLRLRIVPIELS